MSQKKINLVYIEAFSRLKNYCFKKGWKVKIGDCENEAHIENSLITISYKLTTEYKLYMLLHEAGHLKIAYDSDYDLYYAGLKLSKHNLKHKTSAIEEEFDAWRIGFDIAKKLRFSMAINQKNWYNLKTKSVYSHIEYWTNLKR